MKKTILLILTTLALTACTTHEIKYLYKEAPPKSFEARMDEFHNKIRTASSMDEWFKLNEDNPTCAETKAQYEKLEQEVIAEYGKGMWSHDLETNEIRYPHQIKCSTK